MDWLNYHHLRYFWTVAKEGSISRAAAKLHVSQPSISEQMRELESALGEKLFRREGRNNRLTEAGQVVFGFAEEIFALGRETLTQLGMSIALVAENTPDGPRLLHVLGSLPRWRSGGGVLVSAGLGLPAVRRYVDPNLGTFNVRRVIRYSAPNGAVGMYTHHNSKVGVLVEASLGNAAVASTEPVQTMLKAIAEHAAAMNPLALDRSGIAPELVEQERRIAEDQARQSGKPEAMIEKIATGKLEAFFKDMSLVSQPWVREPKKTITDLIQETGKAAGTAISVTRFIRFALGDA